MVCVSALVSLTVSTLLAWVLVYLVVSARALGAALLADADAARLPWTHCNNAWNTPRCSDRFAGALDSVCFTRILRCSVLILFI